MKSPQRIPLLLLAVTAAAILFAFTRKPAAPAPPPPLIALEKMGHLVSLKMHYADVIELTQPNGIDIPGTRREIPLGSTRVLLVARGDCTVATDLRQASYADIDEAARTLTVALPPPAPLQPRISHAPREQGGSYFYTVTEQGLQVLIPSAQSRTAAMDKALQKAQQAVLAACTQPAVLNAARDNAAIVMEATLQATGWTPKIVWEARPAANLPVP